MKIVILIPLFFNLILFSCGQRTQSYSQDQQPSRLPDCEWCGAADAPEDLGWQASLAPENEPGEPMIISGTVFQPDGKSPAEGVIVYVYHTNAQGIYPRKGDETGNGRRHGYLRGWMKTRSDGRYEFTSIRPAPYPNRNEPAHIHYTLTAPGFSEYWLNSTWFEGDTLITEKLKDRVERSGGFSNIISLEKNEEGIWRGERNFILGVY